MTLTGHKARTHPQQGYNEAVDDRATTWEDFNPLHNRYQFTIDAAASPHNTKLPRYWTRQQDALSQPWTGERIWCNPPYSVIAPWIQKAWDEHDTAELIVMLLPANRTEQTWWQQLVEPRRDQPGSPLRTRNLPGRLRFIAHDSDKVEPNERPPFGNVLLCWNTDPPPLEFIQTPAMF